MNIKAEFRWLILIAVFSFLVFANSLNGDFVYDDNRQIVRNPLIQNATLYGKALTSDVWAFKGDGAIASSNYWRPTFVAWLIANYALFGLNPFGWHLLGVLLHVGVCLLAFLLLRRWNLSSAVAFAIALVFAVHPSHSESVAWISGAPDLLFSAFLLGSFWFAENFARRKKRFDLIAALLFYALALGAKEIGILCFPVFWLIIAARETAADDETEKKSKHRKIKKELVAAPLNQSNAVLFFPAIAAVYFVLRLAVLGAVSLPVEEAASFGSAILTVPSTFVFYVRQIAFPFSVAANYPLRAAQTFDVFHVLIPALVSVAILILLWLAAKRSLVQKIGFALFVLPLLPAMNASAFTPEQIVHDRYLYLPLLGFLMVVFPYAAELIDKIYESKRELIVASAAMILCLPLAYKTFAYNPVWASDFSLWQHSVQADKTSAFNWSQYGAELAERGRAGEAIEAYNNSLLIRPSAIALVGQSRNYIALKKYDEAEKYAKLVVAAPNEKVNAYTLYQSYETLTIVLIEQKKYDEAEKFLIESRKRLPIYSAALTEKLAVVLYQSNRKEDALRELEAAKTKARGEMLLESKSVFLRLGMLYAELNYKDEARSNLEEFLRLTANVREKNSLEERNQAAEILKRLQ